MKKKKLCALIISVLMVIVVLCGQFGCRSTGESVDATKSQLWIHNYNGGIGTDWLYKLEPVFEEKYADTSFEKGKKGVQIQIQANKDFDGDNFSFSQSICQVAFCEKLTAAYFVNNNNFLDLTDVMNDIISQEGVSLPDEIKEALLFKDGKSYYAIPHYEGGGGIVYDKDLFDSKSFYIDKDGAYTDASGELSSGPDGIPGNSDDGLPATYVEFLNLCSQMKRKGVVPFIIAGKYKYEYYTYFVDRFAASYNGIDNTRTSFSLRDDSYDYVTSLERNASKLFGYNLNIANTEVSDRNGYVTKQAPGNYYALSMLNEIIANKYYDEQGWASTREQLDAQEIYLKSASSSNRDPIAMLIDGTWWSNEAKEVFQRMSSKNEKYSEMNRNFGWMPLPTKLDENDTNANGDPYATLDSVCAYAIARNDVSDEIKNLIKTFLRFCYSQENLENFTVETGMTRGFQYNLSAENYNKLSPFKKELWNLHNNKEMIYIHSGSELVVLNEAEIFGNRWKGQLNYTNPVSSFFNANPVTPKDYFEDMWISNSKWNDLYSKYFK